MTRLQKKTVTGEKTTIPDKEFNGLNKKKMVDRDFIFFLALLAFPLIQFAIFYIGVNVNSFSLAFKRYDSVNSEFVWAGLENFERVWYELTDVNTLMNSLKNSLVVWFFTMFLGTVIAVFFSYYIYKKFPLHGAFKIILFLPSILPSILLVMIFRAFANEAIPQYIYELTGNMIDPLLVSQDTRFLMAIFFTIWISFGTQVLVYTGSMEQISPSVIEAGRIDGTSSVSEFWHIVVPEVFPAISTFLVAGVAQIFINQASMYSFFGTDVPPGEGTLGYYMFSMVSRGELDRANFPYASALGLCCSIVAIPVTFILRHFLNKLEDK